MIRNPKVGETVQVWYAVKPKRKAGGGGASPATVMQLHGRLGIVRIVASGPGPRNHLIEVLGAKPGEKAMAIAIPAGNLRRPQPDRLREAVVRGLKAEQSTTEAQRAQRKAVKR